MVSAILAVVPYIALVQLGDVLLEAYSAGGEVDGGEVSRWIRILVITFALRLFIFFLALLVTHFADIKLGNVIEGRLVRRLARVPLVWFTSANSGRVRNPCRTTSAPFTN